MFDYNQNEYPYFSYNQNGFPKEEDQINFINSYINEYRILAKADGYFDKDTILKSWNIEQVAREAKTFSLFCHLRLAIWAVKQVGSSKIDFGFKV